MRKFRIQPFSFLLFVFQFLFLSGFSQEMILHCGKLIDTENGEVSREVSVLIAGNNITNVVNGYTEAKDADTQVIDLRDYTVMPGLIDLHVHIEHERGDNSYIERFTLNPEDIAFNSIGYAKTTLMAGFTTVRDVGGSGVNISLRNAINTGKVIGPRIFTAGRALATTGGHADPTNGYKKVLMGDPGPDQGVINGPADASKGVRQAYKNGSDLIKITATGGVLSLAKSGTAPQFTKEELEALISTANDYGMHVAAHAHGKEGMKRAVIAGVRTIEHGTLMDEEVMDLMVTHGTYYVPTITAGRSVADSANIPGYFPEIVVPKAKSIGPQIEKTFGIAVKKGVRIAFGTDAGVFAHGLNAKEFTLMEKMGMPAMQTIQCATKVAAEVLDMEQALGQIKPGYLADIVAVKGDPLKDLTLLEDIGFVMKEGVIYKQ